MAKPKRVREPEEEPERVLQTKPPLTVKPGGVLAGFTFTMRRFTAREYIKIRRGTGDSTDVLEMALDAVLSHDLPGSVDDLSPEQAIELADAWTDAMTESAVPQPSGAE